MENEKQKALISLKKASSLLARIIRMVEEDKYCIDIMQQNLAVIGLLKSGHQALLENHLNTCFKTAMTTASNKKKQEMIGEILQVSKLASR
ncbi:MAG: metal-sensing transcriptional repressor [bacterium]